MQSVLQIIETHKLFIKSYFIRIFLKKWQILQIRHIVKVTILGNLTFLEYYLLWKHPLFMYIFLSFLVTGQIMDLCFYGTNPEFLIQFMILNHHRSQCIRSLQIQTSWKHLNQYMTVNSNIRQQQTKWLRKCNVLW